MCFKQVVADKSFTTTSDGSEEVRCTIEHLNDTSCISEENGVVVSSVKRFDCFLLLLHVLFSSLWH